MPKNSPLRLLILVLALVFLAVLASVFWHSSSPKIHTAPTVALPLPTPPGKPAIYIPARATLPGQPAVKAVKIAAPVNPGERSHIADNLNSNSQNAIVDLAIVANLFDEYRLAYGAFPVGEDNAQILNAISGNNPKKLVFIARNHPALNSSGALLDRWGTPYFFHFQSSQEVEIRSAGPDRDFYTADDLVREMR